MGQVTTLMLFKLLLDLLFYMSHRGLTSDVVQSGIVIFYVAVVFVFTLSKHTGCRYLWW